LLVKDSRSLYSGNLFLQMTRYVVRTRLPTHVLQGMYEMYRGMDRNIVLKRLSPGIRYSGRVKAINAIGESAWSPIAAFSTQASVPATPDAPAVASASSDAIVLLWPPVAGNGAEVTGYQVEMDDGEGGEMAFVGRTHEAQFSVGRLRSGLTYQFRVRAENSEGYSQWSRVSEARTAPTPPQAPRPPTRSHATHSSIAIAWTAPEYDGGSPVLAYQVEMEPKCSAAMRDWPAEWLRVYEGCDPACTLGGLRAGCTYRVRIKAVNAIGEGPYSMAVDVATAHACPEAPETLSALSRMQDRLVMTWNPPPHNGGTPILSYKLEYRVAGAVEQTPQEACDMLAGFSPDYQTVYEGMERTAILDGLAPGMRFEFRCAAANKQGFSPWSNSVTVETKSGVPLPPDNPLIRFGDSIGSLSLQWQPTYGRGAPVNSYVVQMRSVCDSQPVKSYVGSEFAELSGGHEQPQDLQDPEMLRPLANGHARGPSSDGSSCPPPPGTPDTEPFNVGGPGHTTFRTVYHGSEPQCVVTDLQPHAEYVFRVKACNAVGGSAWSEEYMARTAPAPSTAPRNLRLLQSTQTSLDVAWSDPELDHGASITEYQLDLATDKRGKRAALTAWRTAYSGDGHVAPLSDLCPGTRYLLRIRALNCCGWSAWSDELDASTKPAPPGSMTPPTISNRASNSLRLSWDPPLETNGAAITSYQLQRKVVGADSPAVLSYSGPDLNCKVNDLSPRTEYAFHVRAVNTVGPGDWSAWSTASTSLAPPLQPTQVHAALESSATAHDIPAIIVKWQHPDALAIHAASTAFEIEVASAARSREKNSGKSSDAKPAIVKQTCSGKMTELRVADVPAGSTWTVRVRGIGADGAGHGDWSDTAKVSFCSALGAGVSLAKNDQGAVQQRQMPHSRKSIESTSSSTWGESRFGTNHDECGKGVQGKALARTVAAKPKPRPKTWVTHIARLVGLRDTELVFWAKLFATFAIILTLVMSFWFNT
jgi:fibronectin type III domain-containing protein 3